MNGILVFGLIFLAITLLVRPALVSKVPEGACHQGYEDVEDNKKYFKMALIFSLSMVAVGVILMII